MIKDSNAKSWKSLAAVTSFGFLCLLSSCEESSTPVIGEGEPFTLSCSGNYGGGDLESSRIWFDISIYPELGKAYIFGLDGRSTKNIYSSTYHGPKQLFSLADSIAYLTAIKEDSIEIDSLYFERGTGRFFLGNLVGSCDRVQFKQKNVSSNPIF